MVAQPQRFEIFWVALDPTIGSEIKKTRPCLIVSPDEMNNSLRTVIIAPLTTRSHSYPTRVNTILDGKAGEIVLDQLRTIDKSRLLTKISKLSNGPAKKVSQALIEMFSM
jgi:mRNA interferase MazF